MNAPDVLMTLARATLQGSALIIIVLLILKLWGHRRSPAWRCALWLIPAIRLLLPISIESPVSLFNYVPVPQPGTAPPVEKGWVEPRAYVESSEAPPAPVSQPALSQQRETAAEKIQFEPVVFARQAQLPAPPPNPAPFSAKPSVQEVLALVWAVGAGTLLMLIVGSTIHFWRRSRSFRPMTGGYALGVLNKCREQMGVRTRVRLVEGDEVCGPAVFGLWRPTILLPQGLTGRMSERELEFVFLHELAHIKRLDIISNWLAAFVLVAHWFNPLVWVAAARWKADREMACDAAALARTENENAAYGRTLLRLLGELPRSVTTPALATITESKAQLEERIRMIARFVPRRAWSTPASIAMALLGIAGLTDAQNRLANAEAFTPPVENIYSQMIVFTNGPSVVFRAVDAETGEPLPDTEIFVPYDSPYYGGTAPRPSGKTDEQGEVAVRLGEISPSSVRNWLTISARRRGYVPAGRSWSSGANGDVRSLVEGPITLRLTKGGRTVGGEVVDEHGNPVSGVKVQLLGQPTDWQSAFSREEFWSDLDHNPAAVTDAAGRWAVTNFPAHVSSIRINLQSREGAIRRFASIQDHHPHRVAAPMDLHKLHAQQQSFLFETGATVNGTIVGLGGSPLPHALVKVSMGPYLTESTYFRADADGRFRLGRRSEKELLLTVSGDGFATTSQLVELDRPVVETRIEAPAPSPVTIHAYNEAGAAVSGARVEPYLHANRHVSVDFSGVTDAEGYCTWTNAPLERVWVLIAAPSGLRRLVEIGADKRQVAVQLSKRMSEVIKVSGRAFDAVSRKPVVLDAVRIYYQDPMPDSIEERPQWTSDFDLQIARSKFRVGLLPNYWVSLHADGYRTTLTRARGFDEGDWNEDFYLTAARPIEGRLLLGDGEPAGRADVVIESSDTYYDPAYPLGGVSEELRTKSDRNGDFRLQDPGTNRLVLITHMDGFLATTVEHLRMGKEHRLQAWAKVQGVALLDGQTDWRPTISLSSWHVSPEGSWRFHVGVKADVRGKFTFERVPPGTHLLERKYEPPIYPLAIGAYQMWVEALPGKTNIVQTGGAGRTVVGKLRARTNLTGGSHYLVLATNLPSLPYAYNVVTPAAERKVWAEQRRIQDLRDAMPKRYPVWLEEDWSFKAFAVPPGEYELQFRPPSPKPQKGPFARRPEPAVQITVRVPGGSDEPYDLGTVGP